MNSRDAAFDESVREILEASAAEALAQDRGPSVLKGNNDTNDDLEVGPGGRKKTKANASHTRQWESATESEYMN